VGNVAQLAARDVTGARPLHLDHVGAEPRQQLSAGRARLHVGEIEDFYAVESLAHCRLRNSVVAFLSVLVGGATFYFLRSTLCGLRLPIRPLSLPAAGSITALIRVGLPEFIAASTARFSSSGVSACTPTPPKPSIILS